MTADDTLARHRYATISCTIPGRLDRVADQLDDILELVTRYRLAEALQPAPGRANISAQGLRKAAARIRTAAEYIPSSGTEQQPGTTSSAQGFDPLHGTDAGSVERRAARVRAPVAAALPQGREPAHQLSRVLGSELKAAGRCDEDTAPTPDVLGRTA